MKRPRFLTALLALVIAGTAAVDSFCIYDVYGREVKGAAAVAAENKSDDDKKNDELEAEREAQQGQLLQLALDGNVSYSPTQLDTEEGGAVLDSRQALEFLQKIGDRFGIENAAEEYRVVTEKDTGSSHLYFLQQTFKGLDVFGSFVTLEADKEGNVKDVEGSHVKIDPDISTEPSILVDQARKTAEAYVTQNLGYKAGEYELVSGGTLFDPLKSGNVVLSYCYYIRQPGTNYFVGVVMINANDGSVSGTRPFVNTEMITLNAPAAPYKKPNGQLGSPVELDVYKESDTSFALKSDDALIDIYLADPEKTDQRWSDLQGLSVYTYDPTAPESKDDPTPDPSAVDALANLERVHSFYSENFGLNGIMEGGARFPVYVGLYGYEGDNYQNNAAIYGGSYMVIGIGTQNEDGTVKDAAMSAYLDVMAHEYTHAVITNSSMLEARTYDTENGESYEKSVQSAFHEGYADIFGEFAEDYANNGAFDNDCDWKSVSRDYSSPAVSQYADYKEFETDGHDGGFLISSPVYKAAQAGVPTAKLSSLYYGSIPMLTAQMTFKDYRHMLERRAAVANAEYYANGQSDDRNFLSDKELEALIDAYDEVGIPSSFGFRLDQGGKLVVLSKDNTPCDNYHIKVTRLYDRTDSPLIDEDVKKDSFVFPSDLANGIYKVTVTDGEDESISYSYEFVINDQKDSNKADAYQGEIKLFTQFGAKSREVVLVLDVSGSMDGDPITQTKLSAQKFVNTVLDAAPATRISIVTYSSSAQTIISSSNKKGELVSTINGLRADGGTNIYDGLSKANDILDESKSPKKLIVLMSDGYPNEGKYENGSYAQPCIDYAQNIKDKDVTIYSLGFFHEMSASEKSECQALMSAIATPGYYFEVSSAEDAQFIMGGDNELDNVFDDLAGHVSGERYIYIRIACPVDVLVKHGGEVLDSSEKGLNTRTDFGTLTFDSETEDEKQEDDKDSGGDEDEDEGKDGGSKKSSSSDDEVKILRLKDGVDYEICITGTGKGKMDYSISYPNDEGEYEDVRKFKNVPITKDTLISTNTAKTEETELSVDTDGDGIFDMIYKAKEDSKAVVQNSRFKLIAIITISAILLVLIVAEIVLIVKRYRYNQVCHQCGAKLANAKKFCNKCGAKAVKKNLFLPESDRPKQKKGVIITKLVLIAVFAGSAAAVIYLYRSPATTVYKQLAGGKPSSAQKVYESAKLEDSLIQEKYLTHAVNRYIDKASAAREDGKYTDEEFEALLEGAIALDVDDITDKAEEYLEDTSAGDKESSPDSSSSEAEDSSADSEE